MNLGTVLIYCFAGVLFLLLNGPLWVSNKLRTCIRGIFARGPEAPSWLSTSISRASRIAGVVCILLWLSVVSYGSILRAVLTGSALASGAFLLWNGPVWLAGRAGLRRGPEAPRELQAGITWFNRVIGAGAVITVLSMTFQFTVSVFS